MNNDFNVRLMKAGEEESVFSLVLQVFGDFVAPEYSHQGAATFLNMISIDFFKENNSEKFTIVAEHKNRLVAMMSVIQCRHIALLFVDSDYQKKGIGRQLIQFGIRKCLEYSPATNVISVSSTPNAQSFYERAGFVKKGEEKNENGMKYIPMERSIA